MPARLHKSLFANGLKYLFAIVLVASVVILSGCSGVTAKSDSSGSGGGSGSGSGGSLAISSSSLPSGTVGAAYSATLQATGGTTPYSWSLSTGSLPAGLTLTASSGAISGTPTASGTSTFTVEVTDGSNGTATASLSIVVAAAGQTLSISTSSLAGGNVGTAYSATLRATGGTTPYSWSLSSGSLPAGLSLNASSGAISGTPTTSGTLTFTAKVTDASSKTASKSLSIAISSGSGSQSFSISTSVLPPGALNAAYVATLQANGGTTPYSWSISSGSLPAGLVLTASTGVIAGTPSASGSFSFTVQVQDSGSPAQTDTANLSIVVDSTSSGNCPTGQPCGAAAPFCASYTPPSTSGATAITSLPYTITTGGSSGSPAQYYLASDLAMVSGTGAAITVNASYVDINLNGHTLTYGALGNQSQTTSNVGQFGISGSGHNVTVENGTITELPTASGYDNFSNCPGASVGSGYAPNPCAPGGENQDNYQPTFSYPINFQPNSGGAFTVSHVTLNYSTVGVEGLYITDNGQNTIECNTFNDSVAHIDNRAMVEGGGIWIYGSGSSGGGDTIEYNTIVGGPQSGIIDWIPSTTISYNDVSQGAGSLGQIEYTNDYSVYAWGKNDTVSYNYLHPNEGRGIETYSNNEGQLTGMTLSNNYVLNPIEYKNNYEYNSSSGPNPGCEIFGTAGISLDTGTVASISGQTVQVEAGPCDASALMLFDEGPGTTSQNSTYIAKVTTGFTGQRFEYQAAAANIYPGGAAGPGTNTGFTSTNDTFEGDTTDFYVDWTGMTGTTKFISPTIVKPTTATGFATFRFANNSSNPMCTDCFHIQDATFVGGASESDVDWSSAQNNNGHAEYDIDWTFNLTVQDASGNPVNGASVTVTGADGAVQSQCSMGTNASGQMSCVVNERHAQTTGGGSPSITVKTPFSITLSASGCSALTFSQPIDGKTSVTKQLSGGC